MDPPEGTQIRAERCSCPFTGVAVDLASAIPIIVPCPFVDAVADRGMGWMTPPVALPLIGVQPRAASRKVCDDEPMTSPPVRVVAHPKTLLARLTRDQTDERRPIIGVGAVAFALIRAAAGRIMRVAMGRAFFPPRSGITRPPQRRCPASCGWGPSHSKSSECAAAGYGAACATAPVRGPGGPSARLWPHRAAVALAWPVVAEFLRRRSLSAAYSSCGKPDNGRLESGPEHGTTAALCCCSAGSASRLGGGAAPTTSGKRYRRVTP